MEIWLFSYAGVEVFAMLIKEPLWSVYGSNKYFF